MPHAQRLTEVVSAEAAEVNALSEPVFLPDRHPSTETLLWAKILPAKYQEVSASVLKIFR